MILIFANFEENNLGSTHRWSTHLSTSTMPKATKQKRNGASHGTLYANSQPKASSNKIFKMDTNIGQHVLKNPGVAQAIVDKADLKQSDVRILFTTNFQTQYTAIRLDPSNRSHVGR